jgi:hypothetical protein
MNAPACPAPLDERELIAYWLGELAEPDEARIDEHLLGCEHCSARLGELVALAGGIREAFRRGELQAIVSDAFVRRLEAQGLHVREYRVPRNGSVNCTVAPEDDFVVSRLEAPLAGVGRLDLVVHPPGLPAELREDIPFDPARGEVVMSTNLLQLRAMPSHRMRFELVAVDGKDRRLIGDYTFNHTAHRS